MLLPSRRALVFFKTRLPVVSFYIKPTIGLIRLNKQNYVAALISLPVNQEVVAGTKPYSIKGNHPKYDSLVTSYDGNRKSQELLDLNILGLRSKSQTYKFSSQNSSHFKNNVEIFTASRNFSTQSTPSSEKPLVDSKLSKIEQLNRAFKEYGPTLMAFHLVISLISFAGIYALVSGGIDLVAFLEFLGISSNTLAEKIATGSTFVVAFAIHKILAPLRISITLGGTPFVVRYLRSKGLLKAKT